MALRRTRVAKIHCMIQGKGKCKIDQLLSKAFIILMAIQHSKIKAPSQSTFKEMFSFGCLGMFCMELNLLRNHITKLRTLDILAKFLQTW